MTSFPLSRKSRSDSVLDQLTTEQKARLKRWLGEENRSYEAVRGLCAREFGVETSARSLCRYYRRTLAAERLASSDKWQVMSDETSQAKDGELFEKAVLVRAQQLAFEALVDREPDVKAASRLLGMVNGIERRQLARERRELEARRVELARSAAERRPAMAEGADGGNDGNGAKVEGGSEAVVEAEGRTGGRAKDERSKDGAETGPGLAAKFVPAAAGESPGGPTKFRLMDDQDA